LNAEPTMGRHMRVSGKLTRCVWELGKFEIISSPILSKNTVNGIIESGFMNSYVLNADLAKPLFFQ